MIVIFLKSLFLNAVEIVFVEFQQKVIWPTAYLSSKKYINFEVIQIVDYPLKIFSCTKLRFAYAVFCVTTLNNFS